MPSTGPVLSFWDWSKNNHFASFSAPMKVFLQLAPHLLRCRDLRNLGVHCSTAASWFSDRADRITPEEIGRLIATYGVTTVMADGGTLPPDREPNTLECDSPPAPVAGRWRRPLRWPTPRKVCEELPHIKLINGYGPNREHHLHLLPSHSPVKVWPVARYRSANLSPTPAAYILASQ